MSSIRVSCIGALVALAAHAHALAAQATTGVAAVDSASVARAAWARAADDLRIGAATEAKREVTRAAAAWPTQPAYLWARAVLSARDGDTTAALESLRAYADLGMGRDLRAEDAFAALAKRPSFAAVVAQLDANRAPIARSRALATLPDSTFWPEGMDVDPRTGRLYVTSVAHRTILEMAPSGVMRELLTRDRADLASMFGVRVDTARGVLWATTSGIRQARSDSTVAALLEIRISDGAIQRRWNLPVIPGGHVLGDLALGPRGDVFVTDSNEPVLYRLRPSADALESLRDPLFYSLQGLAPTPNGKMLYLADYSHGLLRVDLETRAVSRLVDAPGTTSLGCDGIAWDRGAIVAVQNGVAPARIVRFVLDPSGMRIARADVIDRNSTIADEPTIGAIRNGEFLYVANSQWDKHDASGQRLPGKALARPVILAVPLPP